MRDGCQAAVYSVSPKPRSIGSWVAMTTLTRMIDPVVVHHFLSTVQGEPIGKEDAPMVKATVPQRRLVPDGDYDAAFMGLEERTGERPFWFWTFAVKVNADGQSVNLTAVSSPKLSKKAKARPWVEALVRHPLRPLDHVDFNDLIGSA